MKLRSGTPPTTFTIGFPGHGDVLDERALAAESARIIGTDHHDTVMHETDFLAELARCVPRLEEPCGIPSAPALLQLSRFAAQRREGRARRPGRRRAARRLRPPPGRRAAPRRSGSCRPRPRPRRPRSPARSRARRPRAAWRTCSAAAATPSGSCGSSRSRTRGRRTALLGAGAEAEQERLARARAILADVPGRGLLEQALYLDTHMFLPDGILLCNDKMSMAAGLELRVPFLDLELMRFVERIPASRRVGRASRSASTGARWRGCSRRRS